MSEIDNRINIVVIGHGKLANAIISTLPKLDQKNHYINSVQTYDGQTSFPKPTLLIHVGSGRQYQESLALALKHDCFYIQAATKKNITMEPPLHEKIVFITSPNLDLRLIKLFYWVKLGSRLFQNEAISITESHQATKTSAPGTAHKICDLLGIDQSKVVSIRNPDMQKELHIKTLDHHAYHQIVIGNYDSQIKIETKIEGSTSYVEGLYKILKSISNISVGNYEVEELIVNEYI